eukprot:5256308-Heterocapsa_arctica.AAC.1
MSDQILIWVRIGQCEEQKITKKRKVQLDGGKEGHVSAAPFLPVKEIEGKAMPEQCRLTYEARQIIINFFDTTKEPEGVLWKGALI